MVTPQGRWFSGEFWMGRCSEGTLTRLPSAFLPALIAMQSSPVLKSQSLISTSVHDSGSQPSVLGPDSRLMLPPVIVIFCTVTLVQSTGWTCHIGEFFRVTPSISTFLQRYG